MSDKKEYIKKHNKIYYELNKEKEKKRYKEWYENNKDKKREIDKRYKKYKIEHIEELQQTINKQKEVLDKIKETINHYATENEDYSKIYNQEEQEIMKLLEEIE